MVYRIFVEKKTGLDNEARELRKDARTFLGIQGLEKVRLLNRYDAEDMPEDLFDLAVREVFSEPQLDDTYEELSTEGAAAVFAVEYLPGQFDQRADSAAQCIQFISQGERPLIRSAKVYILYGTLTDEEILEIKKYVINPVEAREASLEKPETLRTEYAVPTEVATLEGFTKLDRAGLEKFVADYGLAMDADDIAFCQGWFREEGREPTITEIRMLDTYWSDHCRHTTFLTEIDSARFEDEVLEKSWKRYLDTRKALDRENKPVCLMDLATVAAKYLRKNGMLDKLDESEEINACTVKMDVERDGVKEPWLLLFKNETHNHPTEIEPFGGAATCIGGAIRDPLSGRAYVYGAMRVTGAADPTRPVSETIPGKLPQRKLVTTAAAGYASYGNQIGLATGIVDEIYHPGYAAKRMEIGAVIAAAPAENVRRECPAPGDIVILLGGSTGRDGIGGATGSSKAHNAHSVETCGAEVQKGNAPEERKLQRLFRNPKATKLIKRCNDFGAGGVSVAIGELADGLDIDLNAVPKKYDGLDGTELAISESQERMAVVVAAEDAEAFLALAAEENLQACPVAKVKAEPRLTMRWNGNTIVDISRDFLNSNGAPKHTVITPAASKPATAMNTEKPADFAAQMKKTVENLAVCSRRGLSERFDSTIGAGSVLMPFGGKHQLTPVQAMVQKISLEKGHTDDCSLMAWGYDPEVTSFSPYHGAYLAVVDSVSKLVASGASFKDVYLTFQEYFEKPGADGKRWGKPLAALLGAFDAQMDLGIAAIGGKDSMSGSFEKLDVPPTLVSFAVTTAKTGDIISSEFKQAGHPVILLEPERDERGLPVTASLLALYDQITGWIREGKIVSCRTLETGGSLASVMKMALGNGMGFAFEKDRELAELAECRYGSFIAETDNSELFFHEDKNCFSCRVLGTVLDEPVFTWHKDSITLKELRELGRNKLEKVYPTLNPEWTPEDRAEADACWPAVRKKDQTEAFSFEAKNWPAPAIRTARPRVLIPAFPGTNCEIDSARAMVDAGAETKIFVVRNRTAEEISRSAEAFADEVRKSQMIFIPGGFSGGDEPDGSAKFITAFFRNKGISETVTELLEKRDGLMCGICNGFQALIKLGLVPYGKIIETDEHCPTLTFNTIGRHQSRIVRTRVASTLSPWLRGTQVGEVYSVPISHGEGRFLAEESLIRELAAKGQIATQYVDLEDQPSMDLRFNPNGSLYAIEGITSPDGRVFGKMGHSERTGKDLYKNVPGNYDIGMFRSAVEYFR